MVGKASVRFSSYFERRRQDVEVLVQEELSPRPGCVFLGVLMLCVHRTTSARTTHWPRESFKWFYYQIKLFPRSCCPRKVRLSSACNALSKCVACAFSALLLQSEQGELTWAVLSKHLLCTYNASCAYRFLPYRPTLPDSDKWKSARFCDKNIKEKIWKI